MPPAALIQFNDQGGVKQVYLLCDSDREQQLVEYGLQRITKPSCWNWITKLYGGARVATPWKR